jgi:hypothetical protein
MLHVGSLNQIRKYLITVVIFEGRDTSLNLPGRLKENHKILQAVALMYGLR